MALFHADFANFNGYSSAEKKLNLTFFLHTNFGNKLSIKPVGVAVPFISLLAESSGVAGDGTQAKASELCAVSNTRQFDSFAVET